jgi:Restriction alleviation protein Lar
MKIELEASEAIAPCPMCGSSASLHQSGIEAGGPNKHVPTPTGSVYWVKCDDVDDALRCGTSQPAVADRDNALARWNRRA